MKNNTIPIPQGDDLCRCQLTLIFYGSALIFIKADSLFRGSIVMTLSIQDLLVLKELPSEEQISLDIMAIFFKEHLCNRLFHYKIRDKRRDIRLHLRTFDLPHLLGIHKMLSGSSYRGSKGFPALASGELTLEMLKKANIGAYDSTIQRILHFPFLYQLMYKPQFIIFNPKVARSMIEAEFMLYNAFSGRYLHLGIKKEKSTDLYVPVTFLERKNVYPGMKMVVVDELEISPE
ncbi:hypothetical protein M2444_006769 [Paenibacillus sp. PastF-3]|uniref:PBECR4 domain-containing protein n=1 Tax=Paenibacillus sp. PastF-3 TaxID=2940626 RepID=UPI002474A0B2|nr:PBECR4 domain-containing protein [Paenibacillus sp. PastF-3]MDH6374905.1 hypothetical protein [Paenibacillus sp. PastF-3]